MPCAPSWPVIAFAPFICFICKPALSPLHRHLWHPSVDDWNFRSSGRASSHWAHNDIDVLASLRKCLPLTKLILLNTNKHNGRHQSSFSNERVDSSVCSLQGQAFILAMAGSVCNLQQRIFESLVSYAPGFAGPCLTGCPVFFRSLLIVPFQSILGLCNCRRCWCAPQSMSFILTLDYSDHTGEKEGPTWWCAAWWRLAIHSVIVTF